ncbi:hypothetical protein [Candidatus Ornithobacterium hominis]|uniref:hypothetical protein n=1 Tax=Candidatus Ornithobacterium hominis TaxID=2497989 RepID=UPI001058D3A5|nr:hypothetical protein [Candidatus Ornithobacterium hominis]
MKLKKILLGAVISLTVFSCNQDDLRENEEKTVETEVSQNETQEYHGKELILGKQKENPYSLANMQKTVNIIATTRRANLLKQTKLKPTHQYVVFVPENQEHLETLLKLVDSKKYVTRSYPMDYEIEQYGEEYVDKRAKSKELPVLYASIPVTDKLPDVPYEKLEDLYLTDNENDPDDLVEATAIFLTEKPENIKITGRGLQTKADRITQLKEELDLPGGIQSIRLFGRKYYPEGNVLVYDTNVDKNVPVRNTEIEIYNWFFNSYCYTDDNGHFRSKERYSREMGVYFTWRSSSATIRTSWNEIIGIRTSDKLGNIRRGNNGKTFVVDRGDTHKWSKATTHNAVQKFNDYLSNIGINQRVQGLNIWVFNGGKGRGAALMLKTYPWGSLNSAFAGWVKWLSPVAIPIASILNITSSQIYPDLFFNFNNKKQTLAYEKLVFHEAAHAIHAKQAGKGFWETFSRRTIENILNLNNDPYGNGTQPSAWSGQNIALCEGWANFMQNKIIYDLYGPNEEYNLENFKMVQAPQNSSLRDLNWNTGKGGRNWFLHGLMWDLTDNNQDNIILVDGQTDKNISMNNNTDRVVLGSSRIHPVRALFEAMGSGESTGYELKNRLKNANYSQRNQIEELFNAYGY